MVDVVFIERVKCVELRSFMCEQQAHDEDEVYRASFAFPSICVNGVQTAELVERTVASGRGLVFCVHEDW